MANPTHYSGNPKVVSNCVCVCPLSTLQGYPEAEARVLLDNGCGGFWLTLHIIQETLTWCPLSHFRVTQRKRRVSCWTMAVVRC